MKWDTYKRLTPMQQKEWEFRFKDNNIPTFGMTNLVVIYAFIAIFMCLLIIQTQLPDKFPYHSSLALFIWTSKLTTATILIWIAELAYSVIAFFITWRKEQKWLKEATVGFIFEGYNPRIIVKHKQEVD